jgi:GH24 family phage-related lysozyme (muramidase)
VTVNFDTLDPSIPRQLAIDVDAAEKNELVAYPDTLGNWTCGRGHLLPQAAPGRSWQGFTVIESTSDRWFCQDLLNAMALAKKWPEFEKCDTGNRQNALYEIAFNMGSRWGQFVHARAAIVAQNWPEVKNQLLDSLWAKQVQPHGLWEVGFDANGSEVRGAELPGRAMRIANYFLNG